MPTPDLREQPHLASAPSHAWWLHLDLRSEVDPDWDVSDTTATTYADGLLESVPPRQRGESGTYSFVFRSQTYAGRDPPGDEHEHIDRYQRLLACCEYAGNVAAERDLDGVLYYREQTASGTPSLLVGLEPAYETPATEGIWALIDGYDETNHFAHERATVDLEVTMVAPLEEYESHAAVRAALEM